MSAQRLGHTRERRPVKFGQERIHIPIQHLNVLRPVSGIIADDHNQIAVRSDGCVKLTDTAHHETTVAHEQDNEAGGISCGPFFPY
jgi:hypothetical protein